MPEIHRHDGYGVAYAGQSSNCGTVWKLTKKGFMIASSFLKSGIHKQGFLVCGTSYALRNRRAYEYSEALFSQFRATLTKAIFDASPLTNTVSLSARAATSLRRPFLHQPGQGAQDRRQRGAPDRATRTHRTRPRRRLGRDRGPPTGGGERPRIHLHLSRHR